MIRITAKQKAARRKNIAVARQVKNRRTGGDRRSSSYGVHIPERRVKQRRRKVILPKPNGKMNKIRL